MSKSLVRRSGAVIALTLVLGLVLGVLPASAAATATARVDIHNVLAGQDGKAFTIVVNNTEPNALLGGRMIREVRIFPPADLVHAVAASGPSAFNDVRIVGDPPAEVRFRAPVGSGIAPAGNGTFSVVGDITSAISTDMTDRWVVRVSSDLSSYLPSTATGEGLNTDVRVLQAQNVAILSPSGASDDRDGDGNPEVTGTQENVCVRTRVFNAASTALNVTPALSGASTNVGPARTVGATPCSGAVLAGGAGSINAGSSRDFDFLVSFSNVGSKQISGLTATATANGASTPSQSDPDDDVFTAVRNVAIEPRANLAYAPGTLFPRAVVPGSSGVIFTLEFDKAPGGSPPLTSLSGDFQTPFTNPDPTLRTPTSLPEGGVRTTAEYTAATIQLLADGRYDVTPRFAYTDANGLTQGLTALTGVEQVRLDAQLPKVFPNIVPPAAQVTAVPPVEPAVTNGQAFSINGNVTDADPATGADSPCGPNGALQCTLVSAELIQYPLIAQQGGGTPLGQSIDVTNQVSLSSSGNLSGSINTGAFATGVQSTRLRVTVQDEAGSFGTGQSSLIDVDIVAPDISAVTTSRGPTEGQRRSATVNFSEAVQNGNSPLDWTIQDGGNKVVASVVQSADKRSASLTTASDFTADVTGGTATYNPSALGSPYHDRVGQDMATPKTTQLTDGIEPLAPVFSSVNGVPAQDDGKYYFNSSTPTIALANGSGGATDPSIKDGYEVEVYKESNGVEGLQRSGDTKICGDVAAGASIELSCNFGPAEMESTVYALSIDVNDNVGRVASAILVLDITRPIIQAATMAGDQVTVTLSEGVSGRNSGGDWTFFARRNSNGQLMNFAVGSVSGTGNVRVVTVNDPDFDPASFTASIIRYRFDGESPADRYRDRAANELLDSELGIG